MRAGAPGGASGSGSTIWLASSSEVRAARPSPPARRTISSAAPSGELEAPAEPLGGLHGAAKELAHGGVVERGELHDAAAADEG